MKTKSTRVLLPLCVMGMIFSVCISCEKDDNNPNQRGDNNQNPGVFTCGGLFTDSRDGTTYKTVSIGNQCWFAENLAYLPYVIGEDSISFDNPLFYVYGYNGDSVQEAKQTENYITYGVLYNWPAAMNNADVIYSADPNFFDFEQGACPDGWHLPSDTDFDMLIDYLRSLGNEIPDTTSFNFARHLASTTLWLESEVENSVGYNVLENNSTGFNALPSGILGFDWRVNNTVFYGMGEFTRWWSTSHAYNFYHIMYLPQMRYDEENINNNGHAHADQALPIRCVKNY